MLKLMPNQVAISIPPVSDTTKGGLILPASAKEAPQIGKVIALGEGRRIGSKIVPYDVKVGDQVLFAKYAGTQIQISDTEYYLVLHENDILAIVE